MSQKKNHITRRKKINLRLPSNLVNLLKEVGLIVLVSVAIYMLVCLITYSYFLENFLSAHTSIYAIEIIDGRFGLWFAEIMFLLFGRMAYLFLIILSIVGWRIYRNGEFQSSIFIYFFTCFGLILAMIGACGLEKIYCSSKKSTEYWIPWGGLVGHHTSQNFISTFGIFGTTVILLVLFLSGITLVGNISWIRFMDRIGYFIFSIVKKLNRFISIQVTKQRKKMSQKLEGTKNYTTKSIHNNKNSLRRGKPTNTMPAKLSHRNQKRQTAPKYHGSNRILSNLTQPVIDIITDSEKNNVWSKTKLNNMSKLLVMKLKDFNVDVSVKAIQPGPVITRFEIEPARGIKVNQISSLEKDLARSLSVVSVRVVDNVPGKTVVGIEIPNAHRVTVRLVEGLLSQQYNLNHSPLTLVLGKDISGDIVIADLMKMPHVLIAGTTGSGKSVCINALILSLLYKSTPEQVRMIMVDPKLLELSVYNGIPHLLTPVVTDMNQVANIFHWCILEMDRRFRVMAAVGVRNISSFNKKVENSNHTGKQLWYPCNQKSEKVEEQKVLSKLHYIVVIVDELADLIMVAGKKIENMIIRIAQRARAAGIHLILATQRPSVDVVTGLIKANIPTRIAFQVSSKVDSRTVIDQIGAEQLLANGDMLYLSPGSCVTQRIHGSFVSDEEVSKIVTQLKNLRKPVYIDELTTDCVNNEIGQST